MMQSLPAIGTMVKFRLPTADGKGMTVAGTVKRHLDGSRIEVKTQQHGYHILNYLACDCHPVLTDDGVMHHEKCASV